jgi:uncharacterized membrane protein YadS
MSPQAAAMFAVGRASANIALKDFGIKDVVLGFLMLVFVFLFIWISEKVGNR